MEFTKNDLSFDTAKLDYEALNMTASLAVEYLLRGIDDEVRKLSLAVYQESSSLHLIAGRIKAKADNLTICAETLSTVIGMKDRSDLQIINVKEEEKGE